uniref:Copper transporter n=1 Tax=Caenorhabditis japonica TaxID=281687 RepID=A0A8R1ENA9_CAEJA
MQVTLPTNATITTFIDLDTRIITRLTRFHYPPIFARTDPTSGPISPATIEQVIFFYFWTQAKHIFDIVFFIWTLTCTTVLTVAVGLAVLCGVAHFYLGPLLISLRNTHKPPTPEHRPSETTAAARERSDWFSRRSNSRTN